MIWTARSKIMHFLIQRTPNRQAILGLYGVVVFIVYSWTLLTSFYKIPSWMLFFAIGEILSMYAYNFSVNLAESLIILAGLLVLDFTLFLPLKNKEEFQARAILSAFILLISASSRLIYYRGEVFAVSETIWWLITLLLGLPVAILLPKISQIKKGLEIFAERSLVFLYFYLPLSFISIIVIVFRNIS